MGEVKTAWNQNLASVLSCSGETHPDTEDHLNQPSILLSFLQIPVGNILL